MFKLHTNEILVLYDKGSSVGKKTLAYAHSMSDHVKDLEFSKANYTTTMWKMFLKILGKHPKELLNKAHPYYKEHIKGRDFDSESWLKVLVKHPELIRAPIVIKGNKAIICDNPTDIYKLS
ncbi:MAG: glutaredoxin [Chitinophagales bacterium]|nr:glutaredoxin [Chitinophagales bacterium]